jgi:hypothetical protein
MQNMSEPKVTKVTKTTKTKESNNFDRLRDRCGMIKFPEGVCLEIPLSDGKAQWNFYRFIQGPQGPMINNTPQGICIELD